MPAINKELYTKIKGLLISDRIITRPHVKLYFEINHRLCISNMKFPTKFAQYTRSQKLLHEPEPQLFERHRSRSRSRRPC